MSGDGDEAPRVASPNLEIPIEPIPTEPLVPRPAIPEPDPTPVYEPEPTQPMTWIDLDDDRPSEALPTPEPVPEPVAEPVPEREAAGPGVLRPTTPRPAARGAHASPRLDKRHPVRAGLGLLTLALLAALALAAAIGMAIVLIAFAFRKTVG